MTQRMEIEDETTPMGAERFHLIGLYRQAVQTALHYIQLAKNIDKKPILYFLNLMNL